MNLYAVMAETADCDERPVALYDNPEAANEHARKFSEVRERELREAWSESLNAGYAVLTKLALTDNKTWRRSYKIMVEDSSNGEELKMERIWIEYLGQIYTECIL